VLAAASVIGGAGVALAQDGLDRAAERARGAWMRHDMTGLFAESDTVRLQLPGVARSAGLDPAQAARLLARYVGAAREVGLEIVGLRRAGDDHAYAETVRRFVIAGTDDERQETVFIGFRFVAGMWRVREVRVVP
jgi:hypothetical protein